MSDLSERDFVLPDANQKPLAGTPLRDLTRSLGNDWQIVEGNQLVKTYRFKDFKQALEFTNAVGDLAETVNHHPEISLAWGKATLTLWTHSIGGLSEADFIFAARCDRLTK